MDSGKRLCAGTILLVMLVYACSTRSTSPGPGGPFTLNDFLNAYNAYSLAQLYLKRGRHAEAIVEYEQSLMRFTRLDEAARTRLREEFGLSQEQIERELSIARALAQERAMIAGDTTALERLRERVLAGFYPYGRGTPVVGKIGPGTSITRSTWQSAQGLLPSEVLDPVINGAFTIVVQETTDLPPSEEFIVATLGSGANVRLSAEGSELTGYTAGLPFPVLDTTDSQAGLKAAWNLRYRDAGDRLEQWSETVSRNHHSEIQYAFPSYYARIFGMYRARAQGNLPEWERNGIVSKEYIEILALPFGSTAGPIGGALAGQSLPVLRYRYESDRRPIGQWMISPEGGKLRTVAYNPEGSALGFTMILEDVFDELIPTHEWRLVTTKIALVPGFVKNAEALFGGPGGGYPLDPWELRRVYVVETIPRNPNHPYSRKVLYVDQQTFAPFYAVVFDADNAHWRTMFLSYGNPAFHPDNRAVQVPILLGRSWIDAQARRTTVSLVNKAVYNRPLSPDLFTLSGLMQRGK